MALGSCRFQKDEPKKDSWANSAASSRRCGLPSERTRRGSYVYTSIDKCLYVCLYNCTQMYVLLYIHTHIPAYSVAAFFQPT